MGHYFLNRRYQVEYHIANCINSPFTFTFHRYCCKYIFTPIQHLTSKKNKEKTVPTMDPFQVGKGHSRRDSNLSLESWETAFFPAILQIIHINISTWRKSLVSNPLFILPGFFFHFSLELSYGYLWFEGNGKIPLGR